MWSHAEAWDAFVATQRELLGLEHNAWQHGEFVGPLGTHTGRVSRPHQFACRQVGSD